MKKESRPMEKNEKQEMNLLWKIIHSPHYTFSQKKNAIENFLRTPRHPSVLIWCILNIPAMKEEAGRELLAILAEKKLRNKREERQRIDDLIFLLREVSFLRQECWGVLLECELTKEEVRQIIKTIPDYYIQKQALELLLKREDLSCADYSFVIKWVRFPNKRERKNFEKKWRKAREGKSLTFFGFFVKMLKQALF